NVAGAGGDSLEADLIVAGRPVPAEDAVIVAPGSAVRLVRGAEAVADAAFHEAGRNPATAGVGGGDPRHPVAGRADLEFHDIGDRGAAAAAMAEMPRNDIAGEQADVLVDAGRLVRSEEHT